MNLSEKQKDWLAGISVALIVIFVLVGTQLWFFSDMASRQKMLDQKTTELYNQFRNTLGITVLDATIDSPLVMVKLNSAQALIDKATLECGGFIFRLSDTRYAAVANASVGYTYTLNP